MIQGERAIILIISINLFLIFNTVISQSTNYPSIQSTIRNLSSTTILNITESPQLLIPTTIGTTNTASINWYQHTSTIIIIISSIVIVSLIIIFAIALYCCLHKQKTQVKHVKQQVKKLKQQVNQISMNNVLTNEASINFDENNLTNKNSGISEYDHEESREASELYNELNNQKTDQIPLTPQHKSIQEPELAQIGERNSVVTFVSEQLYGNHNTYNDKITIQETEEQIGEADVELAKSPKVTPKRTYKTNNIKRTYKTNNIKRPYKTNDIKTTQGQGGGTIFKHCEV